MVKTASEELEEPEGSTSSEAVRVSPPRREFGPYAGGSLSRWKGQDKVDNRRLTFIFPAERLLFGSVYPGGGNRFDVPANGSASGRVS